MEIVAYWKQSAEKDLPAMESLFLAGHYPWALYIGHIETRYPDYKLEFYRRATKEFTEQNLMKIKECAQCILRTM